jgi:Putative adhesin
MPTFDTPEPILAYVELVAGSVTLSASDREDTVVEVRPRDPSRSSDVKAAEQARIDFRNGRLAVKTGKKYISIGRGGAVDIDVALPSSSRLETASVSADVQADGLLADCKLSTVSGDLRIDSVDGNIKADSVSGDIAAQSVTGNVTVSTASGDVTIDQLEGDVRFQAASGGITIGRLRGTAKAQTASGSIVVTRAVNGAFTAQSGSGEVEVGIPQGTAARLDLKTRSGVVTNALDEADGPAEDDETLVVQVHTGSGDIMVRRSPAPAAV